MALGNPRLREPVGDFYVHLIRGNSRDSVDKELTSSTALLSKNGGKPTVISFYDGGWGGCRPCAAQMRSWASSMKNVQFLEVCVESEAVALHFHRTYGFGENPPVGEGQDDQQRPPVVVNGWIPSRHYMPRGYGQLGCSGFIISDAKGNFVSRKTASFLQFGPQAFQHVESILADLQEEMEDERRKEGGAPVATTIDRGPSSPSRENAPKKQKTKDSDSSSDSASGKTSPTTVASMEAPSSVGVVAMDDEHQICTDSFNRALKDPTFETLQEVFELLRSHFAHEEELIARYAIPPDQLNSPFSPLITHQKDHFRILRIAASELQRVMMMHRSACASACDSGGGSWSRPQPPPGDTPVDRRVLEELVRAFHDHAESFDVLYEDKIPAHAH